MPTELEVRMHAAGDEIDRQIARRAADRPIHRSVRPARRPVWTLAVAGCAGALLMAGLVWLTADDNTTGRPASPGTTSSEVADVTVAPTVVATVATTTPPIASSSSILPFDQRPAIAIGESVMLGAKPQLEVGGFTVYAEVSHQAEWVIAVVRQLRAAEQIGPSVVIQVGTNGQITAGQLDEIMELLPVSEAPNVVFLTVRAPGKPWIDGNNDLIRALPGKYPNQVIVLEWKGLVDSDQIPGIAGDGVHLGTVAAKQSYANYIFDTIGRRDLVLPVE